jgi:hypothetical protein
MEQMSTLVGFLNNQDTPVMALYIIGALILLSLCLTWLVIHFSGERSLHAYAGIVPNIGGTLMAGFVLFVALVTNGVLRDSAVAQQSVDKEAHALHLALSLLDKQHYPLWHQSIASYIDKVVNEEWPDMRNGIRSHRAHDALQNLRSVASKGLPGISPESGRELQGAVNMIDSARENRLFTAAEEVPAEIWAALWITVVVSILFSAAIHARKPSSAYIMAVMLGIVIGSMFFAIVAIDHPFLGPNAISAQPISGLAAGL